MALPNQMVLVVDDNEELLHFIVQLLESAGYIAIAAGGGREADQATKNCRFDLVLTDLMMPEKNGFELIEELRKTNPKLPVVAMSGGGHLPRSEVDTLDMAKRLGAHALLEKPFTSEQLLGVVRRALAMKPA